MITCRVYRIIISLERRNAALEGRNNLLHRTLLHLLELVAMVDITVYVGVRKKEENIYYVLC